MIWVWMLLSKGIGGGWPTMVAMDATASEQAVMGKRGQTAVDGGIDGT